MANEWLLFLVICIAIAGVLFSSHTIAYHHGRATAFKEAKEMFEKLNKEINDLIEKRKKEAEVGKDVKRN